MTVSVGHGKGKASQLQTSPSSHVFCFTGYKLRKTDPESSNYLRYRRGIVFPDCNPTLRSHDLNVGLVYKEPIGHLQELVTCLYIFCLQWGWDGSVVAQKTLQGNCESVLRGRKFFLSPYLIYLGEQCFCLCKKLFFDRHVIGEM